MAKKLEELRTMLLGTVTYLPDEDVLCLSEYAAKVPDNGIIVDIGTADGASALIMAVSSKPSVQIWTIDPQESQNFYKKCIAMGLEGRIRFLHGKSEDMINQWPGYSIDLLFVDGMHSYQAVLMDVSLWGAFVKDGSRILIHDTLYYDNTVGLAARQMLDSGLLKKEKLIENDLANVNNMPVGLLVTKKLPWHK